MIDSLYFKLCCLNELSINAGSRNRNTSFLCKETFYEFKETISLLRKLSAYAQATASSIAYGYDAGSRNRTCAGTKPLPPQGSPFDRSGIPAYKFIICSINKTYPQ
jgi:hypothetical protein